MRTKFNGILTLLLAFSVQFVFAQKTVSGTVSDDGGALPGVSVVIKGTKTGTETDFDGKYSIQVKEKDVLQFSYVGKQTIERTVGASSIIDVKLLDDANVLDEVVVTAMGVKREKKSLGYASQQVGANDLEGGAATTNVTNLLSGKVAGVDIRRNNNFGGSTNVIIRGNKSLTGNNQALWVIDGVPVDNGNSNSSSQQQGAGGYYDYGNNAADINQEDIESINVLKGAAATALYGSRASNGVILITTKKGKSKNKGIGFTLNSGITVGFIDESTFAKYQNKYGAGYGPYYDDPYFLLYDVNDDGIDDQVVPTSEDASYGAAFNSSQMVYQWDSFTPYSSHFGQAYAWTAAENGPITFFNKAMGYNNSLTLESSNDKSNFFASYSRVDQTGIMPNSELSRDQFSAKFSYKINDKLTANVYSSVSLQSTKGRNSTGYSDNIMSNFRQWWQTNVDIKSLKEVYENSGHQNITWNWSDPVYDRVPIYWDNPYFTRYQNYSTDDKNRLLGYASLEYQLKEWLNLTGRVSLDTYSALQEERRAVGSIASTFGLSPVDEESGYQRKDLSFKEVNYDLMANFNKDINEDLNLSGVVGVNIRRQYVDNVLSSTIGGLVQPGIYALSNSKYELPFPVETKYPWAVNGIYGQAALGYKDTYFVEGSIRRDVSSTLPEDNNSYIYPAISGSLVFSNLLKEDWLSYGKFRINYAEVGNDAPPLYLVDTYIRNSNFHDNPSFSLPNTVKNSHLKPEKTRSFEVGLETSFLKNRIGFDFSVYRSTSIDQIVAGAVSSASGDTGAIVNGGEIENKGIEVQLNFTPIRTENFQWKSNINWSTNKNKVVSLPSGLENLQLGSFQGGVTINATPGEAYGTIKGTDYIYHEDNGQPIVNQSTGRYLVTTASDNVIGNINPDWIGGFRNSFSYKNLSLSFLIDVQKGGDIFSLDMSYGLATGLYPETAVGTIREDGIIHSGVAPDGTTNTVYTVSPEYYGNNYGYRRAPNKSFIYDASFVKLREVSISYALPNKLISSTFLDEVKFSLSGTNLWIIHKNLPYADPESGLSSGNLSRGYSVGSLPTTRDIGFNVNFKF